MNYTVSCQPLNVVAKKTSHSTNFLRLIFLLITLILDENSVELRKNPTFLNFGTCFKQLMCEKLPTKSYMRQSGSPTKYRLFKVSSHISCESTIIPDNKIGIRQVILQLSLTDGQALIRCDCLKICITNRLSSDPKLYCSNFPKTRRENIT
ncbi:KRAB-A domain-containing protein 2-like [Aphis craccivora]|uniref:KRAB-A domain-containing protein 2-like n=1 Tax=Aphis craccivora TaxID=307492 RepID=A0A6G0ZBZ8_APHCR|nr:KRAB-A domain-containing protein 2-like [Aphis craccivora]